MKNIYFLLGSDFQKIEIKTSCVCDSNDFFYHVHFLISNVFTLIWNFCSIGTFEVFVIELPKLFFVYSDLIFFSEI